MYMMFIFVGKKVYNSMGIREDNLNDLYQKASEISKEIFKENPHAIIEIKVSMYI